MSCFSRTVCALVDLGARHDHRDPVNVTVAIDKAKNSSAIRVFLAVEAAVGPGCI